MEAQLEKIREARIAVTMPDKVYVTLIVLAVLAASLHPYLGSIFGITIGVIAYKRINYAAKLPCPNCNHPFGTSKSVALGVGGSTCQNCNQHLYIKSV